MAGTSLPAAQRNSTQTSSGIINPPVQLPAVIGRAQLERLWMSLLGLGRGRLGVLALVGVTVFESGALGGYYLSRPDLETLYGASTRDISRIGATLKEAGIAF
jgi:flagellar M-ring protein FliF